MSERWEKMRKYLELRRARASALPLSTFILHEVNMALLEMDQLEVLCDACGREPDADGKFGGRTDCHCEDDS